MAGGADSVVVDTLSAQATVFGGAGGDEVQASAIYTAVVSLGNGNDFVSASYLLDSQITLGAGSDNVEISAAQSSTFEFGAGADTFSVLGGGSVGRASGYIQYSEVAMGGGADSFEASAAYSSSIAMGAGVDTFAVSGLYGSTVQGGGNSDTIFVENMSGGSRINGGAGADVIDVNFAISAEEIFGDAGNDTITVLSGSAGADVLAAGGDGVDDITIEDQTGNNAVLFGGAGADTLFAGAQSNFFRYDAASESNIDNVDNVTVSANQSAFIALSSYAGGGAVFVQANSDVGAFSTNAVGVVTFSGAIGSTLEERATLLSSALGDYRAVIFNADGGRYLFVAGNVKNQITDDLLIEVDASVDFLSGAGNRRLEFGD